MIAPHARSYWQPVYVGLGSNLGDSVAQLQRAIEALRGIPETRVVVVSPIYRSVPFGPVAQPDFANAVVGLLTTLELRVFFTAMRALEGPLGRKSSGERWGPREIDLDLLAFGAERYSDERLVVPHPGIPERDFVLYPLRDVAPALNLPGMGIVSRLAQCVPDRGLRRID